MGITSPDWIPFGENERYQGTLDIKNNLLGQQKLTGPWWLQLLALDSHLHHTLLAIASVPGYCAFYRSSLPLPILMIGGGGGLLIAYSCISEWFGPGKRSPSEQLFLFHLGWCFVQKRTCMVGMQTLFPHLAHNQTGTDYYEHLYSCVIILDYRSLLPPPPQKANLSGANERFPKSPAAVAMLQQ